MRCGVLFAQRMSGVGAFYCRGAGRQQTFHVVHPPLCRIDFVLGFDDAASKKEWRKRQRSGPSSAQVTSGCYNCRNAHHASRCCGLEGGLCADARR